MRSLQEFRDSYDAMVKGFEENAQEILARLRGEEDASFENRLRLRTFEHETAMVLQIVREMHESTIRSVNDLLKDAELTRAKFQEMHAKLEAVNKMVGRPSPIEKMQSSFEIMGDSTVESFMKTSLEDSQKMFDEVIGRYR